MAADSFTEVTSESWFGRIGNSIKGIVAGLVLFGISFPLLWWNEGRAVDRYKTLAEGASTVLSVAADKVDPGNEGKLLHTTGKAVTEDTVTDKTFGVSAKALKLRRKVEMYQWKQEKHSRRKKKLGGGTKTVTTYTYTKNWSGKLIDSQKFRQAQGHENPSAMPYQTQEWLADTVTLGAFRLATSLVRKIDVYKPLPVSASALPEALRAKIKINGEGLYLGADPNQPRVGDTRIAFAVTPPTEISVVAGQTNGTLSAYQTKAGGSLELLQEGTCSADIMFHQALEQNRILTWILRLAGFLCMGIGLGMILRPISVISDVIPLLGSLVGLGLGLVAFLAALCLSLVTIGLAWVAHRPVLGIGLLAGAGAIMALILMRSRNKSVAA
jgi:hypothetical protein